MSKHRTTWVVLADGEHARFVTAPPDGHFHTFDRLESPTAHLHTADLGSDKPGRVFESADVSRHAIAPRHDPHDQAKKNFAANVAANINQAAAAAAFERLIVAAPARVLQEIREHLSPATSKLLAAAIAKDLTRIPDGQLGSHFPNWPLVPAA